MRLQLAAALALAVLAMLGAARGPAHADGSMSARGVYYKERATRVMQPMLDGMFEVGARGLIDAHFLVDAITSASASSGSAEAEPFTERRGASDVGEENRDELALRITAALGACERPAAVRAEAGVLEVLARAGRARGHRRASLRVGRGGFGRLGHRRGVGELEVRSRLLEITDDGLVHAALP